MKKLSPLLLVPLLFCSQGFSILSLNVEPIIGYERIQKLIPTRHTTERLVYGARLIAGLPLISAEGEVTRGSDTETFTDEGLTVKDTTDKAKLGLRSTVKLVGLVYGFARAGAQAKKNRHEETRGGVTVATDDPIYIHPYAGAGLRAKLGKNLRFDADFTVIFADTKDWKYYEYQTTAGFAVEFP